MLFQHFFTIPERDQAHRATEAQKQKSGAGDRLRFHMLRTLSRSREHRIEEEGPPHTRTRPLQPLCVCVCVCVYACVRVRAGVWWLTPRAEEEDGENEDVLFNLAQTVNLSYFDYHSADVIGETTTETTPNIPSTHPVVLSQSQAVVLLLRLSCGVRTQISMRS